MNTRTLFMAAAVFALAATPTLAANVDVKMLNKGDAGTMVFEPALIHVAPGDTVTFLSTDKGHNAETIPGMLPEGAEPFKTKLSADAVVTFDVPGVYGIKCLPHYAMGMIALVVVGEDTSNLEEAQAVKHPRMAQDRFADIYAELDQ